MTDALHAADRTIAVWGHFHGGNLGDELVAGALLHAIRERMPAASLMAITMAPEDAARRHRVPAFPINPLRPTAVATTRSPAAAGVGTRLRTIVRAVPGARQARAALTTGAGVARELPFAVRSFRRLQDVDSVVVAGSGQLLDAWRGPWWHPYTTFRWALLARLAGTAMLYPSVGAGPIDGRLSGFLIRKAVDWGAFVSVRDEDSARVLRSIGVTRELPVSPDMGWAYDSTATRPWREAGTTGVVGVNAMAHQDPRLWPRGEIRRYRAYLEKTAHTVAHLLADGHGVLLFSSQTRADRLVVEDLRELLAEQELADHPALSAAVDEIETVDDLVQATARCDYVIAARFHCVLLPLALGIPTIGLAYHPKTRELLDQVGHGEWCLDIDRFEAPELIAAFDRLRAGDTAEERAELRRRAGRLRRDVEAQFETLFGTPPPR